MPARIPIAYELSKGERYLFIPKTHAKPVCGSCGAETACEWALCPLRQRKAA